MPEEVKPLRRVGEWFSCHGTVVGLVGSLLPVKKCEEGGRGRGSSRWMAEWTIMFARQQKTNRKAVVNERYLGVIPELISGGR